MTFSNARPISTNQTDIHEDLLRLVERHRQNTFAKPIAEHTSQAFEYVIDYLTNWESEVIIDACCGVGESTVNLAKAHPNARVVGIDKSIARLNKHNSYQSAEVNENYILVQADLVDFWRLLAAFLKNETNHKWHISKQFILYPNPYPKKSQVGKRWYASAVFKDILSVCKQIEWRSNWDLYLQECLVASKVYGLVGNVVKLENTKTDLIDKQAFTPFERKYLLSGQTCFKLFIHPEGFDK